MFKKIIYIVLIGGFFLTGCSLDREPKNGPSSGNFPASEKEALSGVLAAYKSLSFLDVKHTPFPMRVQDCISDIGTFRIVSGRQQIAQMNSTLTSDMEIIGKLYSNIYKVIGRVHFVLDNLYKLQGKASQETIDQFRAELLVIRSFYYDLGTQYYGDIPFIDHCLNLKDFAYPRTPRKEITERILFTDLTDEILDALPLKWSESEYGTMRVGRVAAYAIKARIALNWGYCEEAARCSKKALDLSDGLYGLESLDCTYYPDHTAGEPSAANLFGFEGQSSKEWLWAIQYDKLVNYTAGIYYQAPRTLGGCSWFGPTQSFMDTFQCKDGKSIAESPLYDWKNPWANRDPRLDLFCVRNDSRIWGKQFSTDMRTTKVMDYVLGKEVDNSEAFGNKCEYGANGSKGVGGYLWRKYLSPEYYGNISGSSKTQDDLNAGVIRFAELLLIDAEANIEIETGDLLRAAKDINMVRARVNMPPVTDLSREGLRKALRYERKVELCNEGYRWFDLRRWRIADKAVDGPMYAPPFSNTRSATKDDPYAFLPNGKPIIDDNWIVSYDSSCTWDGKPLNLRVLQNMKFNPQKDYLWPIPYNEIISNPKITENNPGY